MLTSSRFIDSDCDCDCVFVPLKGSVEACDVLLFLLWLIQTTSLSGRRTLPRWVTLCPFSMPVELVRGGMALGDAKGWDRGRVGEFSAKGWPVEDGDGIVEGDGGSAVGGPI